jgi:ABC-type uncharacterized transport system substrate-binding protein
VKRREFITLIGGASAWPLMLRAQQPNRTYHLAFLSAFPREAPQNMAVLDELRQYGLVEGQNFIVDERGFSTGYDKFSEVATRLVKSQVDAILCSGEIALRAAQQATRTIPILGVADDMVAAGLVPSLARPGGNVTGISILASELDGKRQQILMEVLPNAHRMAALADPNSTQSDRLQNLKRAAVSSGVELSIHMVDNADQIAATIDEAKSSGLEAVNFLSTPLFNSNRHLIIDRVVALRLPSIHHLPEISEDGGLVAFGARITLMYRQMARLLVKILHGTAPADLPVEQPAVFELVFNLKTAAAIGVDVPSSLLLRADKIIE